MKYINQGSFTTLVLLTLFILDPCRIAFKIALELEKLVLQASKYHNQTNNNIIKQMNKYTKQTIHQQHNLLIMNCCHQSRYITEIFAHLLKNFESKN